MRIRIKNVTLQELIFIVTAYKNENSLLISKKTYEELKNMAEKTENGCLSFMTEYGVNAVETLIKLRPYCDEYFRIESVTVGSEMIYGYSQWVGRLNQIAIDTE